MQFGDAVDEIAETLRLWMGSAVPGLVGRVVAQAKIGRQVDQGIGERLELCQAIHQLPVRQAQEQHVAGFELGAGHEAPGANPAQVRMQAGDRLAGMALGGRLLNLDAGMKRQDTQ